MRVDYNIRLAHIFFDSKKQEQQQAHKIFLMCLNEIIITNVQEREHSTHSNHLLLANSTNCASLIQSPTMTYIGVSNPFSLPHVSQVSPKPWFLLPPLSVGQHGGSAAGTASSVQSSHVLSVLSHSWSIVGTTGG